MKLSILTPTTIQMIPETEFEKSFMKEWDVRSALYGQKYIITADFPETDSGVLDINLSVIKKGKEEIIETLYDCLEGE